MIQELIHLGTIYGDACTLSKSLPLRTGQVFSIQGIETLPEETQLVRLIIGHETIYPREADMGKSISVKDLKDLSAWAKQRGISPNLLDIAHPGKAITVEIERPTQDPVQVRLVGVL